jgi:hypothetical protein
MSNNTFEKATDLGLFDSKQTIRIKGRISPADPIDIYKFTIKPTLGFRSRYDTYSRGGTTGDINTSFFVRNPKTKKFSIAKIITTESSLFTEERTFLKFPSSTARQTFYVKFDEPTSNLKFTSIFTPESL